MKSTVKHGITPLDDGRFLVVYVYLGQPIVIGKFKTNDEAHAAFTGASVASLNRSTFLRQKQREQND